MIRFLVPVFIVCQVVVLTGGCTPIGAAVGAGASLGIAATKEGGIQQSASDLALQAQINDLWFKNNLEIFRKLDMTVDDGRVLITGVVQDPQHRLDAVRLAWQPTGVKQVINEIRVADSDGIPGFFRDQWITTQLRTKMTIDPDVQSINYSIDTVQGTVYLMGTARNQPELQQVLALARSVPNVRQVISYVKMSGDVVATGSASADLPRAPSAASENDPWAASPMPLGGEGGLPPSSPAPVEAEPLR